MECLVLRNELQQVNAIQRIRSGNLDTVRPSVVLPTAELCYWDAPAAYFKVLSSSTKTLHGTLVVTDHKVRFVSTTGGFEFPLSKLAAVNLHEPSGVVLQLTRSQGSGFYSLQGAIYLYEILQVILNMHHRKVLYGQAASRSIPQAVKSAVYQRDGGKCVECGNNQYLSIRR